MQPEYDWHLIKNQQLPLPTAIGCSTDCCLPAPPTEKCVKQKTKYNNEYYIFGCTTLSTDSIFGTEPRSQNCQRRYSLDETDLSAQSGRFALLQLSLGCVSYYLVYDNVFDRRYLNQITIFTCQVGDEDVREVPCCFDFGRTNINSELFMKHGKRGG